MVAQLKDINAGALDTINADYVDHKNAYYYLYYLDIRWSIQSHYRWFIVVIMLLSYINIR